MKRSLIFIFLAAISFSLVAQITPKWVRYPSISPDGQTIVFTYKGDLYRVASTGGQATQLTFHEAHDYHAVWSPDSKQIAFASDRYGNFDLFIMDARGGEAKRLTFHSNDETPFSFSPDGTEVLFGGVRQDLASHRQYPTASQPELYAVSAKGGRVRQILTVPAEEAQLSKNGSIMVYHDKKGGENEWRKHHQSSIARDIWMYNLKTKEHLKITDFYGEDRMPIFANSDQDIYYLTEESGSFNINKLSLANPSIKKSITQLKNFPIRFLSSSNAGLLAFSYDGELYTVEEGKNPNKINISLFTQEVNNIDGISPVNGGVGEFAISPDGKEVILTARGEVFATAVEGNTSKKITNTPEIERFISYSSDGKQIYYASERDGRWQIYRAEKAQAEEPLFYSATLINEKPLLSNLNDNYQPKLSPDGKKLAYIENRRTLKVLDIASGKTNTLLNSNQLYYMSDGDQYFEWSPDSKWLLAGYSPTMSNGEVVLLDAEGSKPMINLSQSGYNDHSPKWIGKQIIWFSNRDGLKSHANSGNSQDDVYTIFLTKEGWDEFNLSKDDFTLLKAGVKTESSKDTTKESKPLKIDWDGINERKARLTIHSSNLSDAELSKDGEKLYYLARFEKNTNLWSTDLRTKETKMELALEGTGGQIKWDKDKKNLYLLSGGKLFKINPETKKKETININAEVSTNSIAERLHLFEHVWRRTQKMFYTPDMHGVNWENIKKDYSKYVPHLGNNYEFAEMLSEMLGELNVSHSGARFSRSIPNSDATASLGAFVEHTDDGLKIEEIISHGPLDKAVLEIKQGDIIQKIDGERIDSQHDFAQYLNRKAGKFVLLEIFNPVSKQTKNYTVKPITMAEESQLLYKRWVKLNQNEVAKLSNGNLGYVHIAGMNDGQYRNTYEEIMGKYANTQGIIVDTRFNSGGDLVADLAMFFTGEKFLDYANSERSVGYEPTFRWTKPTLAMFNEANYSDGHCFSCGYTDLKIGKTVGQAVPGTCSFAGWEMLPNGIRWGAVPISVKNKAGEWLENHETHPTFAVKNNPKLIAEGQDQQLQKAIEELLKEIN